jgi:hypothetical protein
MATGTSTTRNPARTASTVMATSTPNPGASGRTAARHAAVMARWPDKGSPALKPHRRRTTSAATRFTSRNPPCRGSRGRAPMARSAAPERTASRSTAPSRAVRPRSASRSRYRSAGSIHDTAASSAPPFPSRLGPTSTLAPAARASAAVPSTEEPSATTTSSTPAMVRMARTVSPTRPASFRAATTAATRIRQSSGNGLVAPSFTP